MESNHLRPKGSWVTASVRDRADSRMTGGWPPRHFCDLFRCQRAMRASRLKKHGVRGSNPARWGLEAHRCPAASARRCTFGPGPSGAATSGCRLTGVGPRRSTGTWPGTSRRSSTSSRVPLSATSRRGSINFEKAVSPPLAPSVRVRAAQVRKRRTRTQAERVSRRVEHHPPPVRPRLRLSDDAAELEHSGDSRLHVRDSDVEVHLLRGVVGGPRWRSVPRHRWAEIQVPSTLTVAKSSPMKVWSAPNRAT